MEPTASSDPAAIAAFLAPYRFRLAGEVRDAVARRQYLRVAEHHLVWAAEDRRSRYRSLIDR